MRKWSLRILKVVGWVVGSLLLLVSLPFLVALVPAGRDLIRDQGLKYANESLPFKIAVGSLDRLDPWGVDARNIALANAKGETVAKLASLSVRLEPFALIRTTVHLPAVSLAHGFVDVDGLLLALEDPNEPKKPEEPATDEESSLQIQADALAIQDVRIKARANGHTYLAELVELRAAGGYGPRTSLTLAALDARASDELGPLAQFATKDAAFDLAQGGHVAIEGHVLDTTLALTADVAALHDDGSFPDGKAELEIRRINRALFDRLGVAGVTLKRPVDLTVSAKQTAGDIDAAVSLEDAERELVLITAAGQPDDARVAIDIAPMNLQALMDELPNMDVAGQIRASYVEQADESDFGVSWARVRVNGEAIPPGEIAGALKETAVRLDSLTVAGLEKALSVSGRYDWQSTLADVALKLAPTRLESVSWLRTRGYRGRASLDVAFRGGSEGPLDGKADIDIERVVGPGVSLARALVNARVDGTVARPVAHGKADLRSLVVNDTRVDRAGFDLDAKGSDADGTFHVFADRARVQGKVMARKVERDLTVLASAWGRLREEPLTLAVRANQLDQGPSNAQLSLTVGKQSLSAQGTLSRDDRLRAGLRARALDLAFWASLVNQQGVAGKVDLDATAAGKMNEPAVNLAASVQGLRGFSQPETDAQIKASANLAARRYALTLTAKGQKDPLYADVNAQVVLPARASTLEGWLRGPYEVHARLRVPARRLGTLDQERLGALRGQAELAVDVSGGKGKLAANVGLDATVRLPTATDDRSDRLKLTVKLNETATSLDLLAHDRDGELLRMNGQLAWPNGSIFAAAANTAWKELPTFRVQAKLSDRRIDEMQGVYAYFAGIYELDMPIKVGMNVSLLGNEQQLSGGINGRALIMADALDQTCALGTQIQSSFDAKIDKDIVEASVWAREAKGGTVNVNASQVLKVNPQKPFSEWLGGVKVEVRGKSLEMRSLPGMCQLTSGQASFVANATALDGKPPAATLELGLENVSAHPQHKNPIGLELYAGLTKSEVAAQGALSVDGEARGSFSAKVPVKGKGKDALPEVSPDAQLQAKLQLDKLPVAPFLSVGDLLGRPSGAVSSRLTVQGPLSKPKPEGFLELHDVSFSVASTAQPLKRMRGRVEVKDNMIYVRDLVAHDAGGNLRVNGQVHYNDNGTGEGKINLRADKLPLRRQGEIIGELTLRTDVEARMPQNRKAEIEVMLHEGRVWLTGEKGRTVQSLEPNPDIVFVDVPLKEREAEKKEEAEGTLGFAYMKIRTDKDLWVMHESFSVQLGVNINFVAEEEATMRGEVELRRGEMTLLGKVFNIQKGAVYFTGDAPPDPELDIKAVHRLPKGEDLIVTLTGRSTAPTLAFSGAADNAGDAVALLSGVGKTGAESKAQDDARNFATNLTAGLLTVAARREFGDWVPVLGVENDESGAVSGARAGFDASKLIPPALRGFARAAYVEGIVGSNEASGGRMGVGVRIEVVLPADLVASWGYGPGATWATDMAWAP